ncbi:DMT family transporter [soil metagenome]
MLMVGAMLWAASLASGGWHSLSANVWGALVLSGLVGIFIGDTAIFGAMNRLGPRRAGVLFATHAMFSAFLGFFIFDERMSLQAALGATLTVSGVMIAVMLGRRKSEDHAWETDRGHVGTGVALALLAALCQALGSLIAKPAMTTDVDPVSASAIRVSIACLGHFALLWCGVRAAAAHQPATMRVLLQTGVNGLISVAVGMTLLLMALRQGDVGMVAILSSVSPVLLLPLLWLKLGRAPAPAAWLGAILTVIGTALILSR